MTNEEIAWTLAGWALAMVLFLWIRVIIIGKPR